MKKTCDELSLFRERLWNDLHGTPVTKANYKKRVAAMSIQRKAERASQSQSS